MQRLQICHKKEVYKVTKIKKEFIFSFFDFITDSNFENGLSSIANLFKYRALLLLRMIF